MLRLLLPIGYALSLVGFTAMRKANLAQYLKPHQVTIALAAAVTIFAFFLAEIKLIKLHPGDGHFDPLVLVLQNVFLISALFVRKEYPAGECASLLAQILVLCSLAAINATECERYSNFILGLISLAMSLVAFGRVSSGAGKDRKFWLQVVWSLFGLCTAFNCGPVVLVYAFAGLTSMWIVKFAHPMLGDKLEPEYTGITTADLS